MARLKFYIDWDEDPKLGGQQGVFPKSGYDLDELIRQDSNWSKKGPFSALLGAKIVSISCDREGKLQLEADTNDEEGLDRKLYDFIKDNLCLEKRDAEDDSTASVQLVLQDPGTEKKEVISWVNV